MIIPDRHEVLKMIWQRSEGSQVWTPTNSTFGWQEGESHNPNFMACPPVGQAYDHYFTPLRFNGKRRKSDVGRPGVIFADMDGAEMPTYMEPSVLIESSPGHYHGYWFLHEPVEPDMWEPRARGWSYEIGADRGGWDLTQVLRQPGTLNHKYDDFPEVRTIVFKPYRLYDLTEFPHLPVEDEGVDGVFVPDKRAREFLLTFYENRVPLSAWYWLKATPEEVQALGTIDRSKIMWQLEKQLLEAGFSIEQVFQIMWFSGVNKWSVPAHLAREVLKAAAV